MKQNIAVATAEGRAIPLPTVFLQPSLGSDDSFNLEGKAAPNICK